MIPDFSEKITGINKTLQIFDLISLSKTLMDLITIPQYHSGVTLEMFLKEM